MALRVNSITLRRWHRRAGIGACLFILLLALSGLALNRSEELNLDQRFVSSPLILNLFGVSNPQLGPFFKAESDYYTQLGERIYRNGEPLLVEHGALIGAVASSDYILLATQSPALLLLNKNGELVERLDDADGLPANIARLGINDAGSAVFESPAGIVSVDLENLRWERQTVGKIDWAIVQQPQEALVQQIMTAHRGHGLSVERALLELHSGRIAGQAGRLLVDVSGVISIVLALSGLLIWWRGRAPQRPQP